MISSFQLCVDENRRLDVTLDGKISTSLLGGNEQQLVRDYFRSQTAGITWICNHHRITILEPGVHIFGLPAPDSQKVVVIYPFTHSRYQGGKNAVIFNDDGSEHKVLHVPALLSEEGKKRSRIIGDMAPPHGPHFEDVRWREKDGENVMVLTIGFDMAWYEQRILDPATGQIGECLGSGLR